MLSALYGSPGSPGRPGSPGLEPRGEICSTLLHLICTAPGDDDTSWSITLLVASLVGSSGAMTSSPGTSLLLGMEIGAEWCVESSMLNPRPEDENEHYR